MRTIKVLPSFERSLKKLSHNDKDKLKKVLAQFNEFLIYGNPPKGLGFKKINHDKYELRVDIRLRIIVKIEDEDIYLILVGNHNDIKRYLREYR
jgi:mRNA-degrading endonuclease RelE of RelBE toxin-antitoxin system